MSASWERTSLCASACFAAACFSSSTATRFCSNEDTIDESCWTNAGLPCPTGMAAREDRAVLEDGAALPAGSCRRTGASGGNGMSTACVAANIARAAAMAKSGCLLKMFRLAPIAAWLYARTVPLPLDKIR